MSFSANVIQVTQPKTGKEYQMWKLPAGEGIKLAFRLSSLILPMFEGAGDKEEVTIDFMKIAKIIGSNIDDTEVLESIKLMLRGLTVDGKEVDFDTYFMGNYGDLFLVLSASFKGNFGSFFDQLDTQGQ